MSDSQNVFEIIRDIGYLIQDIKVNETVWFNVKRDGYTFFTARSSNCIPQGLSETSRAIKEAYKVTRNVPDKRDVRIEELEAENESLREEIKNRLEISLKSV